MLALVLEINPYFEPNIKLLNDSAELGYMSALCKDEEQAKLTVAALIDGD
jgi:hypothetical protein